MKIAVFGGSFNPFCLHHFDILRYLVVEAGFDEVLVVPSAAHPLKDDLLPYLHRLNMTRLGVRETKYAIPSFPERSVIVASDIESHLLLEQTAPVYAIDLLRAIRESRLDLGFGRPEIKFAIGPDIRDQLDQWKSVGDIEREFGFHDIPVRSVHASAVRQMIAEGVEHWKRYVSPSVIRYIQIHNLYQTPTHASKQPKAS